MNTAKHGKIELHTEKQDRTHKNSRITQQNRNEHTKKGEHGKTGMNTAKEQYTQPKRITPQTGSLTVF